MAQQAREAAIDCTSGWYSVQNWQGVPLLDLLAQAGARDEVAGVRLLSATGYHHTFSIEEAERDPASHPRQRRGAGSPPWLSAARRGPGPPWMVLGEMALKNRGS